MRTIILALAAAGVLAACSDNAAPAKPEEKAADALRPGEYEVTAKVDAIRSTDSAKPNTASKVDSPAKVTRTCVPAGGTIDPAAFAEAGEKCTVTDSYMRGGRMSLQYRCNRGGELLTQMVDGNFTAESFTGKVMTATYFSGSGDYELTRTMTGKRAGECTAATEGNGKK
ncbi:MAG: DUF3617 family protein [Sphingomicrobium sp.]